MVPPVHVDAPDITTLDDPPNVPPLRSNVLAAAPPVLLKVNPPPVRLVAITVIGALVYAIWPLLTWLASTYAVTDRRIITRAELRQP